jgi:GntR family transcriptional regulator/MocR family aminotransferase
MPKPAAKIILNIAVDPSDDVPLHRQVYSAIKQLILEGRLRAGDRLPSTRVIAGELGISRTTVLNAVEQLTLEGFVSGRVGSGTRVSSDIPADVSRLAIADRNERTREGSGIARRARRQPGMGASVSRGAPVPLRPGFPAAELLPVHQWARLTSRHWRRAITNFTHHADSLGFRPLREAICEYVWRMRAVRCTPEQVLVTAGAQHALWLCAQSLLDPGESVWMEDPGYPRARLAFAAAGLSVVPVPVDEQGLNVTAGIRKQPAARLIYVTPSFQCPLGVTMSLARRFELLRHASDQNAWILEDDYFSEYRFGRDPVASLQSLDPSGRVIYIGNFSKTIVPFLRIGFAIVPQRIAETLMHVRTAASRQPPGVDQAALAEFISEGHFDRHIRTTVQLYRARQEALLTALRAEANGFIDTIPGGTGMYLVGLLPRGLDDRLAVGAAAAQNVDSVALSTFSLRSLARGGLVLGYSGYDEGQIRRAVRRLCAAVLPLATGARA